MRHALLKKKTETTTIPLDKLKANLAHVPEGKVPVVLLSTGYCPPLLLYKCLQAWGLTESEPAQVVCASTPHARRGVRNSQALVQPSGLYVSRWVPVVNTLLVDVSPGWRSAMALLS
jgi:hypothetical protein